MIAAQGLQCGVGIKHLIISIAIEQLRWLIIHHFADQSRDRFALVEPLAAQLGECRCRLSFVERNEPRDPAITKILMVERIQYAGTAKIGEPQHRHCTNVVIAKSRLQPAGKRRIDQQGIQINRRLRHRDAVALG